MINFKTISVFSGLVFYGYKKEYRLNTLLSQYNFRCNCKACSNEWETDVHSCDRYKSILEYKRYLKQNFKAMKFEDFKNAASRISSVNGNNLAHRMLLFATLFNYFFGEPYQF